MQTADENKSILAFTGTVGRKNFVLSYIGSAMLAAFLIPFVKSTSDHAVLGALTVVASSTFIFAIVAGYVFRRLTDMSGTAPSLMKALALAFCLYIPVLNLLAGGYLALTPGRVQAPESLGWNKAA